MSKRSLYSLLLAPLFFGNPVTAEIYKYTHNGVTTYSANKPQKGAFENLKASCLLSYTGCEMARSDWSRIKLNHKAYKALVTEIANTYAMDAALVRAVIHAESNFNRKAKSRAGAQGLMQLMPATQKSFKVRNPYDAKENITAGTKLLKQLLHKYGNNIKFATAAYNAGESAVAKYRGVPPYEETKNYVKRVAQLYSRYKQYH